MVNVVVPGAIYGKPHESSSLPTAYREISVSRSFPQDALETWRRLYRSFTWRPLPGIGMHADVFVGLPVKGGSAMLCRFRDVGRDPQGRPHTVRMEAAWFAPEYASSVTRELAVAEAWNELTPSGEFTFTAAPHHQASENIEKAWIVGDKGTFRLDLPELVQESGDSPPTFPIVPNPRNTAFQEIQLSKQGRAVRAPLWMILGSSAASIAALVFGVLLIQRRHDYLNLSAEYDKRGDELKKVENNLGTTNEEIRNKNLQIDVLEASKRTLEQKNAKLDADVKTLTEKYKKLLEDKEQLEHKINDLKARDNPSPAQPQYRIP